MTDPKTGGRTVIMDRSNQPVISRLDGDLLREIALETDGVFVLLASLLWIYHR